MPNILLLCFYFMLPVYFANMAPVIVKKLFKNLAIPLDFGKKIGNNRVLGKNKTFRGLIFGIIFAIIITFIQFILFKNNIWIDLAVIEYADWLLIGLLMGSGAIFGDLFESFVKRRINYESGKSLIPFDQLDFIIGALIFIYPIVVLELNKIVTILLLSFVLHVLVNHIAFYLGVRKEKW